MFDIFHLQLRTAQMFVEAHGVVGMRMLGLAGLVPARSDESLRMLTEKQAAFSQSGLAAMKAMMAGKSPAVVYGSALAPVGRTTRANARRLTRIR